MNKFPEALTFRNELDALLARFVGNYKRRDAQACAEAYADDAVLLLPNAPPVRGKTEIAAALQAGMDGGLEIDGLTVERSEADGRIGYALHSVQSGQVSGTVSLVLRRDDNGLWRIVCEAAPNG